VRDRPKLKVVETGIAVERLGICVRNGNTALRDAIDKAQAALIKQWLGAGRLSRRERQAASADIANKQRAYGCYRTALPISRRCHYPGSLHA